MSKEELSWFGSSDLICPPAKLVDCLNKEHPLVVQYVKELKEEIEKLKEENKELVYHIKNVVPVRKLTNKEVWDKWGNLDQLNKGK